MDAEIATARADWDAERTKQGQKLRAGIIAHPLAAARIAGSVCLVLGVAIGRIVLPLPSLGAIYYSGSTLGPVRLFGVSCLKYLVLVNPLVYISEGYRAALTRGPHMSLWGVYGALIVFAGLLTWQGIEGFRARVVS